MFSKEHSKFTFEKEQLHTVWKMQQCFRICSNFCDIECTIFVFLPGLCSWVYAFFSYKKLGFDTSRRLDIK